MLSRKEFESELKIFNKIQAIPKEYNLEIKNECIQEIYENMRG